MSLLFPAYLIGLLGLGLPWLLHRFSDQQPEEHQFPSKRFLESTIPPVSRTRRLKYLALLALRVLSLLLLCFLFAQPWLAREGVAGSARLHHLIAIDRSLSMRAEGRWETALDEARDIIGRVPEADSIELVSFDRDFTRLADDEAGVAAVIQALGSLEAGYTSADYGQTMQRLDKLAADAEVPVKLWLITDEQSSAMPAQLNALYAPRVAELEIRSVLSDPQRNVHLQATAQSSDGVNVQLNVQLMASLSGNAAGSTAGSTAGSMAGSMAEEVTIQVAFDGRQLAERRLELAPGQLETINFDNLVLPDSRNPILEVFVLEDDALPDDNRVNIIVRTANPTPVVLLESERSTSANAAVYLTTALETDSQALVDVIEGKAERAPPDTQQMITGRNLQGQVDLDVLQFVDGERNALVFRSDAVERSGVQSVQGSEMGLVDESHPLSLGEMDWYGTRFFDVAPMQVMDGDWVLLETSDRMPILVERPTARGRLLILNDRLDGQSSNLPLQPVFVSLMQSVLGYFDASTALPDRIPAGSRVALPANVQVLDPGGEPLLGLNATGRSSGLQLDEPGLYTVIGARGEHALRVTLDLQEANLSTLDAKVLESWQGRHGGDAGTPDDAASDTRGLAARSVDPILLAQGADASRLAVWRYVLPLFVLALLLESALANRRLDVRRDGS